MDSLVLREPGYNMVMKFQWDSRKSASNLRMHGVSFSEAITVFKDPLALIFDDIIHSEQEHREIIIGYSVLRHVILVCFTERPENAIRIFSARKATRLEQNEYEENIKTQFKKNI